MEGATILGISPGTKYVGLAIQRNGVLYDWRVKHYKGAWSDDKLEKVANFIENLIIKHIISHVACKVPHASRTSKALTLLIERIRKIANEYKLQFHLYFIDELKDWFQENIRNKKSLGAYLTIQYPELTRIFVQESKSRHQYHTKAFEAIAALVRCHHTIK